MKHARPTKLFYLAVPKKYGGHQLPLPTLLSFMQQAAKLDGSYGWALNLGVEAGMFAAFMDTEFARKHFSNASAFIAGSGYPTGKARLTDTGYLINGRWKYASGADHATLFTACCRLPDKSGADCKSQTGETSTRALALLPDEVAIERTWNSFGLKATGSHRFFVKNVIIPPARTFDLGPDELQVDDPLYRFPFILFAKSMLGSSLFGIAEHFHDEAWSFLNMKSDLKRSKAQYAERSLQQAGEHFLRRS